MRTALAILLAAAVAGCHRGADAPPPPPPPEVSVVALAPRTLPLSYEFVGEVQPIRRVEVRARVDGIIESRPFTEGAFVKAGDVLYRLERIRSDAAYRSAAAQLANAQRTLARLEPLLAKNAVAQQDVDNARTNVESAQAALDEATKNRSDAVVRAEIDGRVGRTLLEVGALVTGPVGPAHDRGAGRSGLRRLPAVEPGAAAHPGERRRAPPTSSSSSWARRRRSPSAPWPRAGARSNWRETASRRE